MADDIRWLQRLENYKKALNQLKNAVTQYKEAGLNDLEKQGMIQAFEYTFELAWNLIRDYFLYQGIQEIRGSRDAIRIAFKYAIIENGDMWMDIIATRNLTSHAYNQALTESIIINIANMYCSEFEKLFQKFMELQANERW